MGKRGKTVRVNWRAIEGANVSLKGSESFVFVTFEPKSAREREVRPGVLLTAQQAIDLAVALGRAATDLGSAPPDDATTDIGGRG